jgi:hypothetical protein
VVLRHTNCKSGTYLAGCFSFLQQVNRVELTREFAQLSESDTKFAGHITAQD